MSKNFDFDEDKDIDNRKDTLENKKEIVKNVVGEEQSEKLFSTVIEEIREISKLRTSNAILLKLKNECIRHHENIIREKVNSIIETKKARNNAEYLKYKIHNDMKIIEEFSKKDYINNDFGDFTYNDIFEIIQKSLSFLRCSSALIQKKLQINISSSVHGVNQKMQEIADTFETSKTEFLVGLYNASIELLSMYKVLLYAENSHKFFFPCSTT